MKTLLLMRHAKSSWAASDKADVDRPLNDRGQRDAPRMGRWLKAQGLVPDLVISSHARRAADTAAAVIDAGGFDGEWRREPGLYEAAAEAYVDTLCRLAGEPATVLIVAHNPGTEDAIQALTGEDETMPTAAIAHLTLPLARWQDLTSTVQGRLVRVARPREID